MKNWLNQLDDLSRREFAAYAAKAVLGVGLVPVAGAATAFAASEKKSAAPAKGTAKNCMSGSGSIRWPPRTS